MPEAETQDNLFLLIFFLLDWSAQLILNPNPRIHKPLLVSPCSERTTMRTTKVLLREPGCHFGLRARQRERMAGGTSGSVDEKAHFAIMP